MPRTLLALSLTSALVLGACGSGSGSASDEGDSAADRAALTVVAGFYPLEHVVRQVAGELPVEVTTLTAPGIDPHDVELSPQDVAAVGSADLVVYSAGLQSAVDDAVASQAGDRAMDVNGVANLVDVADHEDSHAGEGQDEAHEDEAHENEAHEDDGHEDDGHGHDHGGLDPHFWLDPTRYADVTAAVADRLAQLDPANADTYASNAARFTDELAALDSEFSEGLAACTHEEVVTTHAAFGYLTSRYGLHQIEMTGLTPESEPSPARVAEVVQIVRDLDVPAVYAEVLAGTSLAETVGREAGVQVLVLDPVEGITDASPGRDYLEVMRANLEALRTGQQCS